MIPSAIAALMSRSRSAIVVTTPIASIAMICISIQRRSVVAVALSTSPARASRLMGEEVHQPTVVQPGIRRDEDGDEEQDDEPAQHRHRGREEGEEVARHAGELLVQRLPQVDLAAALLLLLTLLGLGVAFTSGLLFGAVRLRLRLPW